MQDGNGKTPKTTATKRRRQARSASYRHGRRARSVSPVEAASTKLSELDPRIAEGVRAYVSATHGDLGPRNLLAAHAMGSLHRDFIEADYLLRSEGLVITERGADGVDRKKEHPAYSIKMRTAGALRYDPESQMSTPLSMGRGALDRALAAKTSRESFLLDYKERGRQRAIDSEAVPPKEIEAKTTDTDPEPEP